MRALIQRVLRASVEVEGQLLSKIGRGLLVLVGVEVNDEQAEADWIAEKLVNLRIFEDSSGQFGANLSDVKGEALVVSQFTLHADTTKGRRPSFSRAAAPEQALRLYERVADRVESHGVRVGRGRFGAHMAVELVNDGPVTLMIDSEDRRRARR